MVDFIKKWRSDWRAWAILVVIGVLAIVLISRSIPPNTSVQAKFPVGEVVINKAGNFEIQSPEGEKDKKQGVIVTVSAAGSREKPYIPWTRTGIDVKPGDKIRIEASGRVHTALGKLVTIAQTDSYPNLDQYQSWYSARGNTEPNSSNEWEEKRKSLRLLPDQPYGALVGAIWDGTNPIKDSTKDAIGEKNYFEVKSKGELVLAVNDLLLRESAKNLYALPLKDNMPFYRKKLKQQEGAAAEFWPSEKKEAKMKEIYNKKLSTWDKIEETSRWTVWYDDNIGDFSVVIIKSSA
jgi:hypothetical protein